MKKKEIGAAIISPFTPVFKWRKCGICHYNFLWFPMWKITLKGQKKRRDSYICTTCKKNDEEIEMFTRDLLAALQKPPVSKRTILGGKGESS